MLGLLLIYFVGKAFYSLAEEHLKNKWVYAIAGVAVYYAGTFIAGIVIGIMIELGVVSGLSDSQIVLALIALPFGILSCWIFYRILKSRWSKEVKVNPYSSDLLDGDMTE